MKLTNQRGYCFTHGNNRSADSCFNTLELIAPRRLETSGRVSSVTRLSGKCFYHLSLPAASGTITSKVAGKQGCHGRFI
jgi:hypothetical protein